MQSYDDVSADDLSSYIESVVGKTPAQVAGTEGNASLGTALSAPLADTGPFGLTPGSTTDDLMTVAARLARCRTATPRRRANSSSIPVIKCSI
jgi:hypothetical protein